MRRILATLALAASAFASGHASADPYATKVSWTDGGKNFDGYLVWDNSVRTLRPGLVMVPNWWGVTDAALSKAKIVAGKDYVVLLVDMYGREPRPKTPAAAGKASGAVLADPAAMRSRVTAALDTLRL